MIKDGAYHREIGFPCGFKNPFEGEIKVILSRHAQEARYSDHYGYVAVENGPFKLQAGNLVEVQFEAGVPVKAVLRMPWSAYLDLVMVLLAPVGGIALAKTLWFNRASDKHRTLDRSKYVKP